MPLFVLSSMFTLLSCLSSHHLMQWRFKRSTLRLTSLIITHLPSKRVSAPLDRQCSGWAYLGCLKVVLRGFLCIGDPSKSHQGGSGVYKNRFGFLTFQLYQVKSTKLFGLLKDLHCTKVMSSKLWEIGIGRLDIKSSKVFQCNTRDQFCVYLSRYSKQNYNYNKRLSRPMLCHQKIAISF